MRLIIMRSIILFITFFKTYYINIKNNSIFKTNFENYFKDFRNDFNASFLNFLYKF